MLDIHIVTDSAAHFTGAYNMTNQPVTVVPSKVNVNGTTYIEGVNIRSEELVELIGKSSSPPVVISPSEEDFSRVYTRLQRENKAVISIHVSREMYPDWQKARHAVQPLASSGAIAVIDSQSISTGQGMLIKYALECAKETDDFELLVRKIRGAVERIYAVYCVENSEFLLHNNILSSAHSILGTMLGVKPLIAIESGRLVPIEKIRTRAQLIDRMAEYAIEFEELEAGVIIQNKISPISDISRMLQDRLADEFPSFEFPTTSYSPLLAALIGGYAHGLVIMEKEMSTTDEL